MISREGVRAEEIKKKEILFIEIARSTISRGVARGSELKLLRNINFYQRKKNMFFVSFRSQWIHEIGAWHNHKDGGRSSGRRG